MRIDARFTGVTVVTDIEADASEPAASCLPGCLAILGTQAGCRGAALHRCVDEHRWLVYSQWDSWDDWNASLFSARWADGDGARLWQEIDAGRLRLRPRVYEVTATTG